MIECKSSRSDFTSDTKWPGYLGWGDRFFWAVNVDFPVDILPDHTGLIFADAFDGHIIRTGAEAKLPPARRRALMLKFARVAARRDFALRHLDIAP